MSTAAAGERSALAAWDQERDSVLRLIGRLAEIASERQDQSAATLLQETRQRLSEGRFNLAVLGEFKRGKSTLINALLDTELMPVGVIPTTSIPISVEYGEQPRVEVQFLDGRSREIEIPELRDYASESGNPENRKQVRAIRAEHPAPMLAHGLALVDTPGIGSVHTHNTTAAYDHLQHSDAAVFILSADSPASAAELELLGAARDQMGRVLFVLNKVDLLTDAEREEATEFVRGVLSRATGDSEISLFAVSGRARDEGFRALETALERTLVEEKGRILLERAREVARAALGRERHAAALERRALELSSEDLAQRVSQLEQRLGAIREQRRDAEAILANDMKRVVATVLDPSVGRFRLAGEQRVGELVEHEAEESAPDARGRMQKAVAEGIRELVSEWLPELEGELTKALDEVALRHRQRAAQLADDALRLVSELFEVELPGIRLETELGQASGRLIRLEDETLALELVASAVKRLAPGRLGLELAKRDALARGEELVDRHCGRVRYDVVARLEAQEARWRQELASTLEAVQGTVTRATELAVGARQQGAAAVEEGLARITAREHELGELEAIARAE